MARERRADADPYGQCLRPEWRMKNDCSLFAGSASLHNKCFPFVGCNFRFLPPSSGHISLAGTVIHQFFHETNERASILVASAAGDCGLR